MNTTDTLALARLDIHAAVAAADDAHRKTQHARSAADYAAAVLLDPTSTPSQREYATYYLDDAAAMLQPAT